MKNLTTAILIFLTAGIFTAVAQQRPLDSAQQIQQIAVSMHVSDVRAREIYKQLQGGKAHLAEQAHGDQQKRSESLKKDLLSRRKSDSVAYRTAEVKRALQKQRSQQAKAALKRAKETQSTPKNQKGHEQQH